MSEQEQVTEEQTTEEQTVVEEKKAASGSAFYKQKLAEIEAERAKLAAELEAERTRKLQEKEDYKQLWENERQKREQAELKSKELSQTVFHNFKRSAIREEAAKAGILPSAIEDLDLLDTTSVEVETTDKGHINVLGAKEFVELYKERKPHWFKPVGAPTINNGRPTDTSASNQLSAADIVKLQKTALSVNTAPLISSYPSELTLVWSPPCTLAA